MNNFIEIEYFKHFTSINNIVVPKELLDRAESLQSRYVTRYINPIQITDICECQNCNSNYESVDFTKITLSSGNCILTLLTVEQILEKIEGKPKK